MGQNTVFLLVFVVGWIEGLGIYVCLDVLEMHHLWVKLLTELKVSHLLMGLQRIGLSHQALLILPKLVIVLILWRSIEGLSWHVLRRSSLASPRNSCVSVHLKTCQCLLVLVYWVHHKLVDLTIYENMRSGLVFVARGWIDLLLDWANHISRLLVEAVYTHRVLCIV